MLELTQRDRHLVEDLIAADVLVPPDPMRMNLSQGDVCFACADGDQAHNVRVWLEWMMSHHRDVDRPHLFTLNGGPLLIAPECSFVDPEADEGHVLISHARAALEMKDMTGILSIAHLPCGAATAAEMSGHQVIDHLLSAKRQIKVELPQVPVKSLLHVDLGNGSGRRMFAITRAAWMQYCQQQGLLSVLLGD